MNGKLAVRNVARCEKDCLCLYVCPTGATDTEDSVIDAARCVGCGACAEACPAGAISLIPREYPPQQKKEEAVAAALRRLTESKAAQELLAAALPGPLAKAAERSNRIMAEDLLRESGYMLPQSGNVRAFLKALRAHAGEPGFPEDALQLLLDTLPCNEPEPEPEPERWRCTVCGYVHEGPLPEDFSCPRCKQPASKFERAEG